MSVLPFPPPMSARTRDAREFVSLQHRPGLAVVERRHGVVEDLALLRVGCQMFEEWSPVDGLEGGPAGADALQQPAPGIVKLPDHHQRRRPLRTQHIGPQALGERGQREPTILTLR